MTSTTRSWGWRPSLPREVWPPEQVHVAGYPYAGSPYAGSPSPPVTRAWGNGHTDGHGRVNGRPGPGYPPAGGRSLPGTRTGRAIPDTRRPRGRASREPLLRRLRRSRCAEQAAGARAPASRASACVQVSAAHRAGHGHAGAGDRGRRVLRWRRLVLLPRPPAFFRPDQPLREHRDVSGGWLRPAVFGAMDGLVTNSSLIAGIGGGGGGHGAIVLTGIAGLIAGAFSMATGEYISVTSQNELTAAEVELERMQHLPRPRGQAGQAGRDLHGQGGLAEPGRGGGAADLGRPGPRGDHACAGGTGHRPGRPAVAADRGGGVVRRLHRGRADPAQPVPGRVSGAGAWRSRWPGSPPSSAAPRWRS